MKVYAINFNTETFKIEADIHQIGNHNLDEQYKELVNLLNADGLDVIDYSEDIAILVDDKGFEKKGYPIFKLQTEDGVTCHLAGKLLFVRNVYNEESTDFGGIKYEDVFNLRRLLDIQIIGAVR